MNARSVSKSAGRKLGITFTTITFLLVLFRPAKGAEITITVTGTLNGGGDRLGLFGLGKAMPLGTPFTLAFAFDDTKGHPIPSGPCPNSRTGIVGSRQDSPATGTLTVNGKSYVFGKRPDARSSTWRTIASLCSKSEIGINITEGPAQLQSGINIKVTPAQGSRSLTQNSDWRATVSIPRVESMNRDNLFGINPNYAGGTESYLTIETVTVSGSRKIGPGMFFGR